MANQPAHRERGAGDENDRLGRAILHHLAHGTAGAQAAVAHGAGEAAQIVLTRVARFAQRGENFVGALGYVQTTHRVQYFALQFAAEHGDLRVAD